MSLANAFNSAAVKRATRRSAHDKKPRRPAPFSLRLSTEERAQLEQEAAGMPLGGYIRAKVLGTAPLRLRRTGFTLEDREAFGQALALLGRSRLTSNLNQIAHAVNIGSLPMTPETEDELRAALRDVRAVRSLLLAALGLQPEGGR